MVTTQIKCNVAMSEKLCLPSPFVVFLLNDSFYIKIEENTIATAVCQANLLLIVPS